MKNGTIPKMIRDHVANIKIDNELPEQLMLQNDLTKAEFK